VSLRAGPNPFADRWALDLELNRPARVSLRIFSVSGRLVRRDEMSLEAGAHSLAWNGRGFDGTRLPSGVYTYVLREKGAPNALAAGRLVLTR
jgi:flagellar hook assembly protein FlgD